MASSIDARSCAAVMLSEPERGKAGCDDFSSSARTLPIANTAQIIAIAAHGLIVLDAMQPSLTQRPPATAVAGLE